MALELTLIRREFAELPAMAFTPVSPMGLYPTLSTVRFGSFSAMAFAPVSPTLAVELHDDAKRP